MVTDAEFAEAAKRRHAQLVEQGLVPGCEIMVKYGAKGKQKAKFLKVTKTGKLTVQKFRQNSWQWTNDLNISPLEVLYVIL